MKKVLMVTEASYLPTGYGVYTHELLKRLNEHPEIEVAELSCYTSNDNEKFQNIKWTAFANKPMASDINAMSHYMDSPTNEYGEFSFNTVCLEFKPDVVIDIRDPWMFEHQIRSPFRNFFQHILMPTVDAMPQNTDWIDMFSSADRLLTYSEFGKDTIEKQSGLEVNGIASPAASRDFAPLSTFESRHTLGLPGDIKIIGTVMRNQRRKLYPDLFKAFKKLIKKFDRDNMYLYCHTNFPDVGWNIPELLMKYGLSSKVIFTYRCKDCGKLEASLFRDNTTHCRNCGNFKNSLAGLGNSLSNKELNLVYNTMNLYVQYANSEGFGMPQLEAAQAGTPVLAVKYSAMESFIDNIDPCNGLYIPVSKYVKESETGCLRAVPDLDNFVWNAESCFCNKREGKMDLSRRVRQRYSWDHTAKVWAETILSLPDKQDLWRSPPDIVAPAPKQDIRHPLDQANFLINNVLCKPEFMYKALWKRLLKDLTYGNRMANESAEFYFNENHEKDHVKTYTFGYDDAYNEMVKLREYYNTWERNRVSYAN